MENSVKITLDSTPTTSPLIDMDAPSVITSIKAEDVKGAMYINHPIETEKEAKKFAQGFMDFIKSGSMDEKAEQLSKTTGLPAKEISKNFALRTLGVLGTALEVGINTAGDVVGTIINLLARLLLGGVDLLVRTMQRLVRIITLNQGVRA